MKYAYCDFCEMCLVRACCTEPCYIVDLIEPVVCINCEKNKTCEEECISVMFYKVNKNYDWSGQMIRHFKETSILYRLLRMKPKNYETFNYGKGFNYETSM